MKIAFLAALLVLASPPIAHAQTTAKLPRIGYLANGSPTDGTRNLNAFREGLRAQGLIEGRSVVIDIRWAERDVERLPRLAGELIQGKKVDVMLIPSCGRYGIEAVRGISRTVPMVVAVCGDLPGFMGEVQTLAQPGRNTTGLIFFAPELSAKRLELLKELVPQLSKVAVLFNPESAGFEPYWRELHLAAKTLKIALQPVEFRRGNFDAAFQNIEHGKAEALLTLSDIIVNFERSRIVAFAARHRIPAVYDLLEFVNDGGLSAYGTDLHDFSRRAAILVDKILKGAKPGEIPVERPTKFELIINLKAARQLGLAIPPSMVLRADKVIQ